MSPIANFFIFCSGANKSLLNRTPTEINKYIGIGATIFFTGVFAALAAGFALYTIFDSYFLTVPIALFWGLMIFNLDRFIVSTMKKKGSFWRDFSAATPRLILAILISIVIAKPLELKIFQSEIESELVKMQQENFKIQDDLVKTRYVASIDTLNNEIALLKKENSVKQSTRDTLVNEAIMEADGTGGSLQRNLGPIYKTKKAAADKAQAELNETLLVNNQIIANKRAKIESINSQMTQDLNQLERVSLTGFAARLEGLERASARSNAILWANIFIMLLFIAIETAPVITKLMIERSPYDYVLDKHENYFVVNNKLATHRATNVVMSEIKFEKDTTDYKTGLAIKAEKEIATEEIKRRVEELTKNARLSPNFLRQSSLFG